MLITKNSVHNVVGGAEKSAPLFLHELDKQFKICQHRVMKKVKSKKFKDDVPEIPFLYDFYLIYWEDIQSDSSWKEMEDIQAMKPATCVSTGWLVKNDKKVHILMSDYNYNAKGDMGDGGNTTVIPTKNVIKKFLIKGL